MQKHIVQPAIIGHEHVLTYLSDVVSRDTIAHAYLLVGPHHIGKRLVIEYFLRRIFCEKQQACGDCLQCQSVRRSTHPNIVVIDNEIEKKEEDSNSLSISIERVREFQQRLSLSSFDARWQCGIIYNAEMLSLAASHSLLKTLEEPASRTTIILHTNSEDALLPTLKSRCQIIRCTPVSDDVIYHRFVKNGITSTRARTIASLALGRPGYALSLLTGEYDAESFTASVDFFISLHTMPFYERIRSAMQVLSFSNRDDAAEQIARWELIVRDIYLLNYGLSSFIVHRQHREQLQKLTRVYGQSPDLVLSLFRSAVSQLRSNGNIKLIFDTLLLKLPRHVE